MGINKISKGKIAAGGLSLGGGELRIKRLPISVSAASGVETDTAFDLPARSILLDAFVNVKTPESTATSTLRLIDVGTLSSESGGDADGFLVGVSTASGFIVQGTMAGTATVGALLKESVSATSGGTVPARMPYILTTARSVSYTLRAAHTELVGDIILRYVVL